MIRAALGLLLATAFAAAAMAQVKIGVLTDMSSPLADTAGAGSVVAARLAIEDRGGVALGRPVALVVGDHQNRADVALALVRQWYDQDGVDAIADVPNSGIALAVNNLARQRNRIVLFSSPLADRLAGQDCNTVAFAWTWNMRSVLRAAVYGEQARGLDTWFVIGTDHRAGHMWQDGARRTMEEAGVRLLGAARHAVGAADHDAVLQNARASGARAVLVTSAGADLVALLNRARELDFAGNGQQIVIPYAFDTDLAAVGLEVMQGVEVATPFHWNMDDRTRALAKRFHERTGRKPNMLQAGVYSAVLNYLAAVDAAGRRAPGPVAAQLRRMSIDDAFARNAQVLPSGRLVHDMQLVRIKTPRESRGPWDQFAQVSTVPAAQAFRSVPASGCILPHERDQTPLTGRVATR